VARIHQIPTPSKRRTPLSAFSMASFSCHDDRRSQTGIIDIQERPSFVRD
jgi:hypothetical protein